MKALNNRLKILFLFLVASTSFVFISAGIDEDKTFQPSSLKFEKGLNYEENGNYKQAEVIYKKLTKNNTALTAELLYHIGVCQLYATHADSAAVTLQKAAELVDNKYINSDLSIDILLNLGKAHQIALNPEEAIVRYGQLLHIISDSDVELKKEIEDEIQSCKNAEIYMENPVEISIKNLGSNINSASDDHSPVVSLDENQIYYTSRQKSGKENSLRDGDNPEKIYHSIFSSKVWSKNFILEVFFRNFENESALSLSADGSELFLFRNDLEGQSIYESIYNGKTWGKPFKLPAPINSPANETHACLSPDKSTMFFTSDRAGGIGGKDIYLVRKQKDGTWGSLTNLGPKINTKLDEETPVFHYDGKTLYFASEGHQSMGRMDVFYSQMNPDSTWNDPINLGYPINSPDDDFFFAPSITKDHAFYASSRQGDTYGGSDIYRVEFKKFVKGDLAVVEGVVDPGNKSNLQAGKIRILVSLKETNAPVGNYSPNADGKYMLFLETGKEYNVVQKEEGFDDVKTEIAVGKELAYKPSQKFVSFASLKVEPPLVLANSNVDTVKLNAKTLDASGRPLLEGMTSLEAKTVAKNNTSVVSDSTLAPKVYTIQLLALKRRARPFKNYFASISKDYKIKQHRCIDGYTRFTTGSFNSIPDAQKSLDVIKSSGLYKDAFIRNSEHHGENFRH